MLSLVIAACIITLVIAGLKKYSKEQLVAIGFSIFAILVFLTWVFENSSEKERDQGSDSGVSDIDIDEMPTLEIDYDKFRI